MAENLLAIDCGTQSVRALLFNPRGELLAKQRVEIEPYYSTAPGLAEQDPNIFWQALCEACQGLWRQPHISKESIAAVALTTQRSTIVSVDQEGRPLRPAIIWLDQRRTEGLPPVGGFWGAAFKLAGASETVAYLQAECEANWIYTHQPEVWAKTHKHLLLSGYLTYLLTGRFIDSVGCQVAYIPFDYKALRWASKGDWRWLVMPLELPHLPELIPQAQPLGEITRQAAEASGLPAGLPDLDLARGDQAEQVIGARIRSGHRRRAHHGLLLGPNRAQMQIAERSTTPFTVESVAGVGPGDVGLAIEPTEGALPGGASLVQVELVGPQRDHRGPTGRRAGSRRYGGVGRDALAVIELFAFGHVAPHSRLLVLCVTGTQQRSR